MIRFERNLSWYLIILSRSLIFFYSINNYYYLKLHFFVNNSSLIIILVVIKVVVFQEPLKIWKNKKIIFERSFYIISISINQIVIKLILITDIIISRLVSSRGTYGWGKEAKTCYFWRKTQILREKRHIETNLLIFLLIL